MIEWNEIYPVKDYIGNVIQSLKEHKVGLPTGIDVLDVQLCGLEPTDYIIVAGRPSMGKTSFAVGSVLTISQHVPVLVFSLEMDRASFIARLLAHVGKLHFHKLKVQDITSEDWKRIDVARKVLENRPILIDSTSSLTPLMIRRKLEAVNEKYKIGCVVIDYLQLMSGSRRDNRNQEVTEISREIRAMTKDFNIPFVVLSQLNRAPDQRADKRPLVSDLRESGSLEQDADKVLLLHRPSYYDIKMNFDDDMDDGKAEIIIGKNRSGPVGIIDCVWCNQWMGFANPESF